MRYLDLVAMWNEEFTPPWDELTEQQKIVAFDEGRRSGFIATLNIRNKKAAH